MPPWAEALAAAVGRRVAHYRNRRGLTAQQLSDALRELGVDLKRTVIGNLESGYRRTVSLSEILAIAYVLGVPPLLLMTPVGEEAAFGVLPDVDVDPWDAARWITGEGPPPNGDADAIELWRRHVDLLTLYREHQAKEDEWRRQTRITEGMSAEEVDRLFERALTRRREIEDSLRLIRRAIRGRGDLPPALSPELAHLDDDEPSPRLRRAAVAPNTATDEAAVDEARRRLRERRNARADQEGTPSE